MRAEMNGLDRLPTTPPRGEFTICRDHHSRWLEVEAHGLLGGVFVNRKAAERFAFARGERGSRASLFRAAEPGAAALTW
jgi:hypothetical protein